MLSSARRLRPLVLLFALVAASSLRAQEVPSVPAVPPNPEREASWSNIIPNLASDQKNIWLFTVRLAKGKHLLPTLAVVGTTAALVALDSHDAPYFRKT